MITRFRVEGKGEGKPELIDELASAASKIIMVVGPAKKWECTDDVISGDDRRGYKGRMVLKLEEGI
jgi:hypothetical protein